MTQVASEMYFEIDGLHCEPQVLGESLTVERQDILYRVDLPSRRESFSFTHASVDGPSAPRDYEPTVALVELHDDFVEVRLIRVVINLEVPDPWNPQDSTNGETAVLRKLISESRAIVTDLCNWTRVLEKQDWMSPPERLPRLVSQAQLIDISDPESATLLPTMILSAGSIQVLPEKGILDRAGLARVGTALQSRGSPRPDDLLLADARHLVHWRKGPSDPELAILLAAMAVEVRTKAVLQDLATGDQADLVTLLIDNPRDWSLSAHAHFAKAIEAILGRDLGKEWRRTARAVQGLFEARNQIAHRGKKFGVEQARVHVDAATVAIESLASLEDGRQS